jgi:phosphate transport system permease protein
MMSLPLLAYTEVATPEPSEIARGFGAALTLLILVLILFVVARAIGGRAPGELSRRQQRRGLAASQRDAWRIAEQRRRAMAMQPLPLPTQEETGR